MTDINCICKKVKSIIDKYDETDPFKLCDEMGIIVLSAPMGMGESACKGFFLSQSRIGSITVNSDLSPDFRRVICAHELGHAVLHKNAAGSGFHDFSLLDSGGRLEYEANVFAAELLMSDEEVLSVIDEEKSVFSAAARLYVPAQMLDFKLRIMKSKGCSGFKVPLNSQSNFLKNITE